MTNYAFQGVGELLKLTSALAIHLTFAQGFWLKPSLFFVQIPQPKGVGLVILLQFCHALKSISYMPLRSGRRKTLRTIKNQTKFLFLDPTAYKIGSYWIVLTDNLPQFASDSAVKNAFQNLHQIGETPIE